MPAIRTVSSSDDVGDVMHVNCNVIDFTVENIEPLILQYLSVFAVKTLKVTRAQLEGRFIEGPTK